jgi:hypothetical protein
VYSADSAAGYLQEARLLLLLLLLLRLLSQQV